MQGRAVRRALWNVYHSGVAQDPGVSFAGLFETWDTAGLPTINDRGEIDGLWGARQAASPPSNAAI